LSQIDFSNSSDEDDASDDDEEDTLSRRLHLSHTSELNPFERALGPFFEVLQGQSRAAESETATVVERESMGVPIDIGVRTEEDKSRSTLLGVPRGSIRSKPRGPRKMKRGEVPEVPSLLVVEEGGSEQTAGSRPPSLSMSLSTDEDEASKQLEIVLEEEKEFSVFLDRSGEVYGAILSFLRDGILPPSLALPPPNSSSTAGTTSSPNVDASLLSLFALHPPSAIALFASLRALSNEASWLGMDSLVAACEVEREKLVEVVAWLQEARRTERKVEERGRRVEVMKGREKAGWI
jgi:hypothetical protein